MTANDRRIPTLCVGSPRSSPRTWRDTRVSWAVDEEGTLAALKAHRKELIDPLIAQHQGRIVKTTGDGLLIEFASIVDAVRCAVVMQQGMEGRNANVDESHRIRFRVGINVGDVIVEGDDIFGDGVNVAARLEALAEPGQICVSATVREHVGEKLPIRLRRSGRAQREEHRPAGPCLSHRDANRA